MSSDVQPRPLRDDAEALFAAPFKPNVEIEYLRAAAIAFVLVMHAPILLVPRIPVRLAHLLDYIHPATGVDLFFVVSGYLIGRTFVRPFERDAEAGAPRTLLFAEAVAFWIRRAWRLFPAAWLWLAYTMAANLISGKVAIWLIHKDMFHKVVASVVALRNFEESRGNTFFGYMWSLSVENQFYALLPVFLLAVRRRYRVPALLAVCALNAVWRPGGETWWMFRYDGLLYGYLLAAFERRPEAALVADILPRTPAGRAAFGLLLGTVVLTAPKFLPLYPLAWTVVCLASTCLVFAASRQQGAIVCPIGLRRAATWLGARSYAVYLCHIPLWLTIVDLSDRWPALHAQGVAARAVTGCAIVAIAAELTYRCVELPGQRHGRDRARRYMAAARVAAGAH